MNITCTKCGSPCTGKFCGKCGTSFPKNEAPVIAPSLLCAECKTENEPTAKFCGKCGTKMGVSATSPISISNAGSSTSEGFVSWNFLPGEIARRLSNAELTEVAVGGARGYIIAEGQRALIYSNGQLIAESGPGRYLTLDPETERKIEAVHTKREGGVMGALSSAGAAIARFIFGSSEKEKEENKPQRYSEVRRKLVAGHELAVTLVRSAPFITRHSFKQVRTKGLSSDIALSLRVVVGDIKAFHGELLADKQVVTQSALETYLLSADGQAGGQLDAILDLLESYTVEELQSSEQIRNTLTAKLQQLSPSSIKVLSVIRITAVREELEQIRRESEANLLAEKELGNLIDTNRICNRFQLESNRRAVEEARNDEELNAAMQSINSDGLLREEQAFILLRDIQERSQDHSLTRGQAVRIVQAKHELDYQKERLVFEEQIVSRQLEINRQRQALEAAHALDMERNRRNFERDQDSQDLDVLSKLQSVKDQQQQRDHERALAAARQSSSAQLDMIKQFAGMTAEQIMVANPHLTSEQAAAMAEIAKSKAELSKQDDRVDLMREMQKQQQDLVGKFLGSMGDAMSTMGAAKDAELKRTIQSSDKSEDRMMRVVNTTVSSVSRPGGQGRARQDGGKDVGGSKHCSGCNSPIAVGLRFCAECGTDCGESL